MLKVNKPMDGMRRLEEDKATQQAGFYYFHLKTEETEAPKPNNCLEPHEEHTARISVTHAQSFPNTQRIPGMVFYIHEAEISKNSAGSEVRPVGVLGHMTFNTFPPTNRRVIGSLKLQYWPYPWLLRVLLCPTP